MRFIVKMCNDKNQFNKFRPMPRH